MQKQSPWNSVEIVKLAISLLTPVLIFWLGFTANGYLESANDAQNRKESAQDISRFIYERRVRAELLASSMRRHAIHPAAISLEEVRTRKRDYDEAYARWNQHNLANLLTVRSILEQDDYSRIEQLVEFRLVQGALKPMDHCLTKAYDLTIREEDPTDELDRCDISKLLQRTLDCGYAISDELYRLSGSHDAIDVAESVIEERCPVGA